MMVLEFLSSFFLISGSLLILIGCIGIVNMPDVLCRAHALSKAVTLGIILMLIGLWFTLGPEKAGFRIFLAISFQLFTIPVAGHLFALMAYKKRIATYDDE